jgi:Flp pilus assembly protein TadD
LRLKPDWPAALLDLAWILATSEDSAARRPAEALQLARRGVQMNDPPNAAAFDVLAAALAAAGRFDEAVAAAEKALALATAAQEDNVSRQVRDRLEQYRQGNPFREPQ